MPSQGTGSMSHVSGKINVSLVPENGWGKREKPEFKPSAKSSERLKGDSGVDEPSY